MQLIAHQELTSAAASITFSSIPATFTDLKLVLSLRSNVSGLNRNILINPNGSSANGTSRILLGDGSGVGSGTNTRITGRDLPGNTATSNTFGNAEFYIPNYTSNVAKSISADTVMENNATTVVMSISANLWNVTDAITSLVILAEAGDLMQYSSATLYGILAGSSGGVTVS
jgi:hypothetical protein